MATRRIPKRTPRVKLARLRIVRIRRVVLANAPIDVIQNIRVILKTTLVLTLPEQRENSRKQIPTHQRIHQVIQAERRHNRSAIFPSSASTNQQPHNITNRQKLHPLFNSQFTIRNS
jgi:hypothetical protein